MAKKKNKPQEEDIMSPVKNKMSFIIDRNAYKTALLYASCGQELIAVLYLRKAYGR